MPTDSTVIPGHEMPVAVITASQSFSLRREEDHCRTRDPKGEKSRRNRLTALSVALL